MVDTPRIYIRKEWRRNMKNKILKTTGKTALFIDAANMFYSQKTPAREIQTALKRFRDWIKITIDFDIIYDIIII